MTNIDATCGLWRGKHKSLEISKSVADIEKIKNFVAIDTLNNKKNTGKKNEFSNEFLEAVKKYLPEQPWPKGVTYAISKKMGIPQKKAAMAIGELIKRNVIRMQKDGEIKD